MNKVKISSRKISNSLSDMNKRLQKKGTNEEGRPARRQSWSMKAKVKEEKAKDLTLFSVSAEEAAQVIKTRADSFCEVVRYYTTVGHSNDHLEKYIIFMINLMLAFAVSLDAGLRMLLLYRRNLSQDESISLTMKKMKSSIKTITKNHFQDVDKIDIFSARRAFHTSVGVSKKDRETYNSIMYKQRTRRGGKNE